MRGSYWSNSNFADWIRGSKKPSSASMAGWNAWKESARRDSPIRFWLAEEFLPRLQEIWTFIPDQIHEMSYYINNRFIEKRHCLKTKLKPGNWYEFEDRIIHGLFEELVDFIEIEKAYHHTVWDEKSRKKYNVPWWRRGIFPIRAWRCPESGLDYLKWEMSLVYDESSGCKPTDRYYGLPTPQAMAAIETYELYNWWKNVRPSRVDPYENTTPKQSWEIEKEYDEEDTEMLNRLIAIRKNLWT